MHNAGTKRSTSDQPLLTVARSSKHRKPLSRVTGNTISQSSIAQHLITQNTSLLSYDYPKISQSADIISSSSPGKIKRLWREVYAENQIIMTEMLSLRRMAPKEASGGVISSSVRERIKEKIRDQAKLHCQKVRQKIWRATQ